MSREEVLELFEILAEEGAIVEDGTWAERYIDKILDPQQAAVAAVDSIVDDEVMAPHGIVMALAFIECVPRAAVAAALRKLWLEGGVFSEEPDQVTDLFRGGLEGSRSIDDTSGSSRSGRVAGICPYLSRASSW
jgi:hypothetical protein